MTRRDHQIFFTALGFLAVVLRDVPQEHQALRALTMARVIESFCANALPGLASKNALAVEPLLETYVAEFRGVGRASLHFDRQTLLKIYELLVIQKTRHQQREFYEFAKNDVIADQIKTLVEERIEREALR